MLKKTNYITYDLKIGKKCYSCKEEINTDVTDFEFNLCESCKRDEKINKLFNGKLSLVNKFKFYLISSNKPLIYFINNRHHS